MAGPNLPHGGSVIVEYSPVLEIANRVGRALIALDNPELTEAIRAETTVELAAVESAELGDLTGRAQQAVLLSREGASPAQVAAADQLLQEDPFGPAALREQLDEAEEVIAEYADDDSEEADTVLTGIRLTPLDPRRPARDLVEDLLTAINGCWLLHDEYAEDEDRDDEEESDDETAERHQHHSRDRLV
ncbi:Voldacs domain-containing protein [Kitasatospora sp. GAS1066B]|uniref:Voldacs domain-containing protein n=1 Tax=Kitasatospora sp. GAS1066B TaxID=3156271 RepID=UPI003511D77B